MELTIWKYELQVTDKQVIKIPEGVQYLCVQVQNGVPCLWAIVDPTAELRDRRIETYGTGHPIAIHGKRKYLGSYQLKEGALVFHVFEYKDL